MQTPAFAKAVHRSLGITLAAAGVLGSVWTAGPAATAESGKPYSVSVDNASAKVGEKTVIVARVALGEGHKPLASYRHRIIELTSSDDGVAFEHEVVKGSIQDGDLIFSVGVTPTKPGSHPINGIFRVGYYKGQRMDMVSVPLVATVTGAE